jgi:hypothetical protein
MVPSASFPSVVIHGREIPLDVIELLRENAPAWSLRQSARELCARLDWRGPGGKLQVCLGAQVIRKLEGRGVLERPVRTRGHLGNCGRFARASTAENGSSAIEMSLESLGRVELHLVGSRFSQSYRIWRDLLQTHHYLGSGPLCGSQLRYLISSSQGWLGAIALSAAARCVAGRDRWIGWSQEARRENLYQVVNNSRFLILSHVRVPNLASHILGQLATRVAQDWQERHGYRPVLLETFVDQDRYRGVCYSAANWQCVGLTGGRGRQDRGHEQALSRKTLWMYALCPDFRERLCLLPERRRLPSRPQTARPPLPPAQTWTEEEFGRSDLGDARLEERLRIVSADFFARPSMSLPQACGSRARTKAAYRLLDHPRVNLQSVLQSHYDATARRAATQPVILAVQDTTWLNYSAHPATELLGPICDKEGVIGMLVHDTMAYNVEGTPLGLIDVQCWTRDPDDKGRREHRYELEVGQKESAKWLVSYRAAARLQEQCPRAMVVSLGDREADLYELFVEAAARPCGPRILVRAQQERVVQKDGQPSESVMLWNHVDQLPGAGTLTLGLPRRQSRPARSADLTIRFAEVRLKPPKRKPGLGTVRLWAIVAREEAPPPGVEAVEWRLVTDIPVENFEQAVEKLRWYALRFQIEVYHRTLKSGCKVEDRQLGNAQRLESCLAIDMVVAWRITHLTKLGREVPQMPCTVFFEEAQWKALVSFATRNPAPPPEPPTLREAVRMLAMHLGGFLGRKSDGEPGAETIWRGLQRLDDITGMYALLHGQDWMPPAARELLDSS